MDRCVGTKGTEKEERIVRPDVALVRPKPAIGYALRARQRCHEARGRSRREAYGDRKSLKGVMRPGFTPGLTGDLLGSAFGVRDADNCWSIRSSVGSLVFEQVWRYSSGTRYGGDRTFEALPCVAGTGTCLESAGDDAEWWWEGRDEESPGYTGRDSVLISAGTEAMELREEPSWV